MTEDERREVWAKAQKISRQFNHELMKTGDSSEPVFCLVVAAQLAGVALKYKVNPDEVCNKIFERIREAIQIFTTPNA